MNFVIPMAGRGERFKRAGYITPKMLIEVHGKSLLEWSVDSLPLQLCSNLIFIGLKEHKEKYELEKFILSLYGQYSPKFLWLNEVTRGQAETVDKAYDLIDMTTDLVIFNIDTMFVSNSLKDLLRDSKTDGVLGAFISDESRFSYAKVNDNNIVSETAEKVVISQYALTGLYHFKNPMDFFDVAEKQIDNNILTGGEFYIAPMYNDLIKRGKSFTLDICQEHWILGTPEELESFNSNFMN